MKRFSKDLAKSAEDIKARFHYAKDLISGEYVTAGNRKVALFYIEGATDSMSQRDLLAALLGRTEKDFAKIAENIPSGGMYIVATPEEAVLTILKGDSLFLMEGETKALGFASASWEGRKPSEPPTSSVLKGPREGFTENIKINLSLMRRRLRTPFLMFESVNVGRFSNTQVTVCYVKNIADEKLVEKILKRIAQIDIDGILDSYYVEQFLEEKKGSFFAQTGYTEKPDIVCGKILEGRIAVFVDGSPIVLTLPFLFFENLQQSEDYYTKNTTATFLRLLRVFSLIIGLLLPGVYVSAQVFHYVIVPQEYLLTLMNAIQGLPMTPIMEMIFVLLLFEIINEASFRMPRYVGMAMSIVGALVLGDTAVKAGLISSPSIMIVSVSSIALYTIPEQAGTFKLMRLIYVIAAGLAGLLGMSLFFILSITYLCRLDSYGSPYLAPYAPYIAEDMKDGLVKRRITETFDRPRSVPNVNRTRLRKKSEVKSK